MRYSATTLFLLLEYKFRKELPKLQVISKTSSFFHKFVAFLLKFPWYPKKWRINTDYMEYYWTTIGFTIAYPKYMDIKKVHDDWPVFCHEWVHVKQANRLTRPVMSLLYLLGTPVYFVLFGLLTLFLLPLWLYVSWWWVSLILLGLGVILSFPLPFGYFRAKLELEAYTVSMAIRYWRYGKFSSLYLDHMKQYFTKSYYFYMWPIGSTVDEWLQESSAKIKSGKIFKEGINRAYYRMLYKTMSDWGIARDLY